MIMYFILKILSFLYLCAGVQCVHQVSWLPCQFTDEHVFKNEEGHTETQLIHREALLQFGQIGDAAVNPHGITFLITVSKLDLRRYLEGVETEQLECELRRYSTAGIHVRWPVLGAREYNHWFTFTLKHTNGLFRITGFLRHPSDTAAPGQQDYNSWTAIGDREMLVTTTAMVMKTLTPSVRAGLGSKQKLHCQFAVDHHGPNFDVDWLLQQRGERTSLFSHSSRSVQSKGSGVLHRSLADGDASYTLPFTKLSSEGTYICSVSVLPLLVSMDIVLQIEEAPKVSLNVGTTLTLLEGGEQRVTCEADSYYPLDVEIEWYMQDPAVAGQRVGAPLPEKLQNVLLSSHKHNNDKTYSLTAFFYLRAALKHSGREFTCRVSHKSLRVPIKKSFTLTVEEPTGWMLYIVISLLLTLCVLLCYLHLARRRSRQNQLY
ncbi:LOW QUALITY PROTEIN: tapasin-related protein [Pseudochaenichthys georgianus]|uniref:LOW QUALITY PROTEIN: tapasin-related protein n=1 Tax=Pseudochaenichthys georgianus TaxID=52239 RepID=UPI00146E09D9|nr:LOW QUALITY PROTEIN: tapasin-related protein [Pseudochaenichthys georgianus]